MSSTIMQQIHLLKIAPQLHFNCGVVQSKILPAGVPVVTPSRRAIPAVVLWCVVVILPVVLAWGGVLRNRGLLIYRPVAVHVILRPRLVHVVC